MKLRTIFLAAPVFLAAIAAILLLYRPEKRVRDAPVVRVTVSPEFTYSYDTMKPGVLQHVDRDYTYDYIPEELMNGLLFQGIHRPDSGTQIGIELDQDARIYFFFHDSWDGGYSEIFPNLNDWKKCKDAPRYDIHNGDHGLHMTMYKLYASRGNYLIPATNSENACFNIVFQFKQNQELQ